MSVVDTKELDRLLQEAFDTATRLYQERGFQRRQNRPGGIAGRGQNGLIRLLHFIQPSNLVL